MALDFLHPWLVMTSAALALACVAVALLRRRWVSVLFSLGAALFLLAGAGPRLATSGREVRHLVVVDVSDSMTPRLAQARAAMKGQLANVELPPDHSIEVLQLSDALRAEGAPEGGPTRYERVADALSRSDFNGELVLLTDGRGEFAPNTTLDPGRVILLPAVAPEQADAAVAAIRGPAVLARGSTGIIAADIFCDRDGDVRWRVMRGDAEIASGTRAVRGGRLAGVSTTFVADAAGLQRFRVRIELAGDRDARNDAAEFSVLVTGGRVIDYACDPRVPREADALLAILAADKRNDVRVRHDLPATGAALEGVGLLVINNLPLQKSGVAPSQLAVIADWVRAGGCLLMAGAYSAFAPGGYRGTAIEDLMPVRFRPDDDPPRHTLLMLDTSSSMAEAAGGRVRLEVLKDAARRVIRSLQAADQLAVAGFSLRLRGDPEFMSAGNVNAHENAVEALRAQGQTHIRASLAQGVAALAPVAPKGGLQQRILLITDGEEGEAIDETAWRELGRRIGALSLRVDVVLTGGAAKDMDGAQKWLKPLTSAPGKPDVHVFTAGERGFDDLLRAVEDSLANFDSQLVLERAMEVGGVNVPLSMCVRTSLRKDDRVASVLMAQTPGVRLPEYPLLAYRDLLGRTAAICTPSAGENATAAFWADPFWQQKVAMVLGMLLENAGRANLAFNPLPDGKAELVWIGTGVSPAGDLRLSTGGYVSRSGRGLWTLDAVPDTPELTVFDGDKLLQRIALPKPVPAELARTGNDDVSFSLAEKAGYRVYSLLAVWQPRPWGGAAGAAVALEWLPALLAALCLLAGFALRRRP